MDFTKYKIFSNQYAGNVNLLRIGLILCLLVEVCLLSPALAAFSFGREFVVKFDPALPFFYKIFFVPSNEGELNALLAIYVVILLFYLLSPSKVIGLIVWMFTLSFHQRYNFIVDGGSSLMDIWAFLLLFMESRAGKGLGSEIRSAVSNVAVQVARFQLCLVYFMAAVGKLISPLWRDGNALYYILSKPAFSHPVMDFFLQHPWILHWGCYFTMAFQMSFPFLIWWRPCRKYLMLLGTFLHMTIAFGMGLLTFGLIMAVSYVLFSDISAIEHRAHSLLAWVVKRLPSLPAAKALITLGIRKATLLTTLAISVAAAFWHCSAISLLVAPQNGWTAHYDRVVADYSLPFFPQVWLVFGPQVREVYTSVQYRCDSNDLWKDPLLALQLRQQTARLSPAGYLGRALEGLVLAVSNEQRLREVQCVRGKLASDCLSLVQRQMRGAESFQRLAKNLSGFCRGSDMQMRLVETMPMQPGKFGNDHREYSSQNSRALPALSGERIIL